MRGFWFWLMSTDAEANQAHRFRVRTLKASPKEINYCPRPPYSESWGRKDLSFGKQLLVYISSGHAARYSDSFHRLLAGHTLSLEGSHVIRNRHRLELRTAFCLDLFIRFSVKYEYILTAGLCLGRLCNRFTDSGDRYRLEFLCQFAAECDAAGLSQSLGEEFQCLDQTVRRLIENDSTALCLNLTKNIIAIFFVSREKSLEGESSRRPSGQCEGGDAGICAGQGGHLDMVFNAQSDEGLARIGYGGGSGIGDEGDVGSGEKLVDKFPAFLVFIELVVACRGGMNVEMPEEMAAGAGVLGSNQVDFFQNAQHVEGDVLEVSDGGCAEVECA